MRGLLRNIVVLLVSVFVCGSVMGATYTSKSSTNPGYKFEEDASWNGGSKPGSYAGGTFTVSSNSNITVNGVVYLNGNLDMKNESTIKVADNSTLIISGNFDISDKSKITIGNSASLYVKGNFTTYDLVPPEYSFFYYNSNDRLYVEMDKFSNLAVEGNFTSSNGAQVNFVSLKNNGNGNAPDFYVFGEWSGTAYTSIKGLENVEDEEEFNKNETILNNTVVTTTASLDNCALTVETGNTLLIQEGTTLNITALTVKKGAQLINYGTINFVHTCEDINTPSNCNITGSYSIENGVNYSGTIINGSTGIINCNNFVYNPTTSNNATITFTNEGTINADSIYLHYDEQIYVNTSCNSTMNARSIRIVQDNGTDIDALSLNGAYVAENMYIYSSQGNIPIEFGSDCGDSNIDLTNLILSGNGSVLNVNELTGVDNLVLQTSTSVNVDGILILGKITNDSYSSLKLNTSANSILSLCYNPTKGDDNLDYYGNGTLNGHVCYLSDVGLLESEKTMLSYTVTTYAPGEHQYWHPSGTSTSTVYHVWENDDTPVSESDIALGQTGKLHKLTNTYSQCISTVPSASFLPIELVSFSFYKSRNEFVWTTASETNNDYFVVEYSKNGKDWVECTEYVQSQSDNGYTYGTEPIMPINESLFSYFRLKQVDLNGEFSYSDVITISFTVENPCSEEYEDSKIQIREFGNRYYRLINGELIYCENDNE